ncbi:MULTISPECIES: AlpA family transcriptional regulator [unclassified Nocardia]|uniref:helix-turn-helix transcriptional regulator n=1 Tax=unclassified Nocardia TaxID=2637762 RepID=UPI001CE4322F|nr:MULTISPECIES: helix-turn-helix domain-containing protein [unclassified Nocardia]
MGDGARVDRREERLTAREVAEEYKLNIGTLRYWRHIGYGPASFALGRKIFYRRREVDAWIAEQERLTRRGGGAG